MNNKQLYIPNKISVGFNNREDTYTKQLGYVIYTDHKGVLRKEKSWQSWRDKKIEPLHVDNVPTTGFVLNKGVKRYETNRSLCRVYDPRGFEFEISIPNLLYILSEVDCGRKGLEGEFVYGWDGTELVLVPVGSQEYKSSMNFSKLQEGKVGTKDLKEGCVYEDGRQEKFTYIGRFDWYDPKGALIVGAPVQSNSYYRCKSYYQPEIGYRYSFTKNKVHVFVTESGHFVKLAPTKLKGKLTDTAVDNFADLVDQYTKKTEMAGVPVSIELVNIDLEAAKTGLGKYGNRTKITIKSAETFYELVPEYGEYDSEAGRFTYTGTYSVYRHFKARIEDGVLEINDVESKNPTSIKTLNFLMTEAYLVFSNGFKKRLFGRYY